MKKYAELNLKTGVLSRKELIHSIGKNPALIQELLKSRRLLPYGRSYLATPDLADWEVFVLIAAKYFPKAVVSYEASLQLHGLLDQPPSLICADISRTTNQKNSLIRFRRVSPKRFCGICEVSLHGVKVRTYDPERAIAELFLARSKPARITEVLRRYLDRGSVRPDRIALYDKKLGTRVSSALEEVRLSHQYLGKKRLEATPPDLSTEKQILQSSLYLYSLKGQAGLGIAEVAREAGVSAASVAKYFPNRKKLVNAVMRTFEEKAASNGATYAGPVNPTPREFFLACAEGYFGLADQDELGYRIQKWAIAENNPDVVGQIERVCSPLIALGKAKIMEAVPQISAQEAEVRSILFVGILDEYTHLRWFYANTLKTQFSKHIWLKGCQNAIRKNVIDMLLSPPSE